MRQLRATGFMPNRARMVAASFLSKDLLRRLAHRRADFMGTWSTATSPRTTAAGSGPPRPAPIRSRTSGSSTRCSRPPLRPGRHLRPAWVPELRGVPDGAYPRAVDDDARAYRRRRAAASASTIPPRSSTTPCARERALAAFASVRPPRGPAKGPRSGRRRLRRGCGRAGVGSGVVAGVGSGVISGVGPAWPSRRRSAWGSASRSASASASRSGAASPGHQHEDDEDACFFGPPDSAGSVSKPFGRLTPDR